MTSFLNSVVRGAGNELGRSAMRTVINPVLKGKDFRPIGIVNTQSNGETKNFKLLTENTIQIGKVNTLVSSIFTLILMHLLLIIPPLGLYWFFKESSNLKIPIRIFTLDKPYYKPDGRTHSGMRVNESANVINTLESPVSKSLLVMSKIYKIFGFFWTAWFIFIIIMLFL
jgi:hypothetical protein